MVIYGDFPAAGLVDYGDFGPVAEELSGHRPPEVDVFDDDIVFDYVIGDAAFDLVDIDVVADVAVVNGGVGDARRSGESAGKTDVFWKSPSRTSPEKCGGFYPFGS